MPFQSYISVEPMSNFSFIELEQFYTEAINVFGELQEKKLLKKLPDDISSRIGSLLQQYSPSEKEESTPGAYLDYDTRRDGETVPSGGYTSSDISEFIWKGNVEVKNLFKGQKFVKNYCVSHGQRLSFFAGSKKKPLKAQMVLTAAAHIEVVPDGKKNGNVYNVTELAYPVVTIKFPSVEEGQKWYEAYKSSLVSTSGADNELILCEEDEDDGLLYEALIEDYHPHSSGELSKSVSFASHDILNDENGSLSRSDSRHSHLSENSAEPTPPPPLTERTPPPSPPQLDKPAPSPPAEVPEYIKEEDKIAMLDEEIPECWGEFQYGEVYHTEWSFNLSRTVLPEKDLLSLKRGQMVLVKERVNSDWWKALDCQGQEGLIASCYLSLAFEL
ncbi:hypothetical protein ACHWQZ_G010323 [Mnemiopsis leidyi]